MSLYKSLGGEFSGVEGLIWSPILVASVELLEKPFEGSESNALFSVVMETRHLGQTVLLFYFYIYFYFF